MSRPQLPQLEGVDHHSVELPGLRMHVAEAGSGIPVLLLHGFPQHWWGWRKVIPELAKQFRVICPDLRGAGWTDAPRWGYTRDQLLADVVALLDTLGLDSVHLLTHDYSALVGYQLCLRHRERVLHHLSLSIPPPYFGFDPRMVLALVRRAWFNLLIQVPLLGPRLLGGGGSSCPDGCCSTSPRPARLLRPRTWNSSSVGSGSPRGPEQAQRSTATSSSPSRPAS
jgi:pimeloyl-ACP methyl ester carboxylesterase